MKEIYFILSSVLLVFISAASAFDPSPLQDLCVAINNINNGVFVNGKFCKDPKLTTADDFFFSGFDMPGNTSKQVGSIVTLLNVDKIPGLNTLGISMARLKFAPCGLNAPHTQIQTVLEGTLCVGFVTLNQDYNRFFTKILNAGDVFVFPIGLIHFQYNVGNTKSVAIASLNCQNPGLIHIGNTVFGAKPPINVDVLAKAFQLDKNVVNYLHNQFWQKNHYRECARGYHKVAACLPMLSIIFFHSGYCQFLSCNKGRFAPPEGLFELTLFIF